MKWNKQDLFVFPHIWGHSQTFYFYQFLEKQKINQSKALNTFTKEGIKLIWIEPTIL